MSTPPADKEIAGDLVSRITRLVKMHPHSWEANAKGLILSALTEAREQRKQDKNEEKLKGATFDPQTGHWWNQQGVACQKCGTRYNQRSLPCEDLGLPDASVDHGEAVLQKAINWLKASEHRSRTCRQPLGTGGACCPCVCGLSELRESIDKLLSKNLNATGVPLLTKEKSSEPWQKPLFPQTITEAAKRYAEEVEEVEPAVTEMKKEKEAQ